ncbi:MAG TPA: tRNA(Ile)-lysidine synthetase, partial [Acidobacteriaceae bacterium]
ENPRVDMTLANLAETARAEQAHWQGELARILPLVLLPGKPVRGGGRAAGSGACVAVEVDRLREMSVAMRRRVVRAAAESVGGTLNFAATESVLALCGFENTGVSHTRQGTKGALHLEGGLRAERSARELRFSRVEAT